jgi:hypothetical protein
MRSRDETFLERSNQLWKHRLVNPWLTLAALVTMAVGATLGSGAWIFLGAIAAGLAWAWAVMTIRCPACRGRIYWIGLRERGPMEFENWLLTLAECPACGADGETSPRQNVGQRTLGESKGGSSITNSSGRAWSAPASAGAGFLAGTLGMCVVMFFGVLLSDLAARSAPEADAVLRDAVLLIAWTVGGTVAGFVTARLAPAHSHIWVGLVGIFLVAAMAVPLAGRQAPGFLMLGSILALTATISTGLAVSKARVNPGPPHL